MKVWEGLQKLKDEGPKDPEYGICANLPTNLIDMDSQVDWSKRRHKCFEAWPEYSGDRIYPVPGTGMFQPGAMYDRTSAENMWHPDKPYGAARLRLLDHCIDWFKEKDL